MDKICVLGSLNMDLCVRVSRFPLPGETLPGSRFTTVPGGKGGNQAVALGKLGARVLLAGNLGTDAYAAAYLAALAAAGVDTSLVRQTDAPTGVALIQVDDNGENTIVVAAGANDTGDTAWVKSALDQARDCAFFLMQMEIPMDSVLLAARRIHGEGKTLILDPAPMRQMPEELLHLAHIITPNRHELDTLTPELPAHSTPQERILRLLDRGAPCVLHKRGSEGAYLGQNGRIAHFPAYRVNAVDTTAAGDTFNAGLAAGLALRRPLPDCIRLACAAAALSTTAYGAQTGMPTLAQAEALMATP